MNRLHIINEVLLPHRRAVALALGAAILAQRVGAAQAVPGEPPARPPNILMIALDDLNDWIGCLGGHPQAPRAWPAMTTHRSGNHAIRTARLRARGSAGAPPARIPPAWRDRRAPSLAVEQGADILGLFRPSPVVSRARDPVV